MSDSRNQLPIAFGTPEIGRLLAAMARFLLGEPPDEAPPERVRRRIRSQQDGAEIIIGSVQAGAIVFFATFYALSPKAFPPGTPFAPVPWTLAFYTLFTAARLVLACKRRLARSLVALSVIIDITVLMITIWSFHLQYRAPPALYLKAPTLMYVFILIALRSLRFEPSYVLLAGGSAALGWLFLLLYAVAAAKGAAFTHSYVAYATSYKILLGAEIDKIVSILAVTAVLALALARAKRLLARLVAQETAASDLSRFFAPEVAAQIRRSEPEASHGRAYEAAIVLTDLRGFTELSASLSPPELIALLREYHSRLVPVIRRHGGRIDKYLGDGILASFGAVLPSPSYAADLLRAIDELPATAEAWRLERERSGLPAPVVGIAGAVGDVVFGTVGDEERREYTVIGEVVNLVAKLEKHSKVERVRAVTTRSTFALALEQGYRPSHPVEERPRRVVEGLGTPVDLVVLYA